MPRAYDNVWQGETKRVLTVCSANMLRSPTMQVVLSAPPFNYNTRSCGIYDFALVPITRELLDWTDEIVCADTEHAERVVHLIHAHKIKDKPVVNLRIPDHYEYRNPELIRLITERYQAIID
ncbi:hypothetical protein AMJ74_02030 [candidate division WOR_3 bacterium SM1_77]|uniref:Phosphotyrosine protein phosphatase I domain-containing protein n=1 Tax=candidate division WOR_3 bacterium SM1_77 TaxID=1703778 RepID=A0A0S8K1X4_UNCW3|nr:MAG: hypothetical protein AMJ74_02030 [candidate division WOR_3 bacterium SM1_77]